MTFSLQVLIGPLSLPSLARSAAGHSPLSATISQLNKDDRTAFLFLYFFLLPELFQTFLSNIHRTFYFVTINIQDTY